MDDYQFRLSKIIVLCITGLAALGVMAVCETSLVDTRSGATVECIKQGGQWNHDANACERP